MNDHRGRLHESSVELIGVSNHTMNGRAEKENGCHSLTPAEIQAKELRAKAA
jgi:hypothetical protein